MGIIGVSLIVASVVYFCIFPQPWLKYFLSLRHPPPIGNIPPGSKTADNEQHDGTKDQASLSPDGGDSKENISSEKTVRDRAAMPPPPPPPPIIQHPSKADGDEEQTTPKASPSARTDAVPTFSLLPSDDPEGDEEDDLAAEEPYVPSFPAPFSAQRASGPPPSPSQTLMGPPPPPPPPRLPTLGALPSSSISRPSGSLPIPTQRTLPLPNRGPPSSSSSSSSPSSGLAPPPTHSTKPQKPSRKVLLAPGHSPLDWARISGPNADLRNLPPATPYLRVTPSMLRRMTGRKGKDAWTALGGRVYNISPYLAFHPGGEPELLRCAGRDGNKLFGEIHPWVNYETMLAACLVGLLVEEGDDKDKMEEMD